jgi:thiol-disulfide isomerase/thioredoxin
MAVLYFTDLPRWVRVQYTRMNLESPEKMSKSQSSKSSIYNYNITAENIAGEQTSLSSLRGKKVFISFWASWCVPCIAEFSSLEEMMLRIPELSVVMLNIEDQPTFSAFVNDSDYNLPFYLLKTPIPSELNAAAIPATFILDEDGIIIYKHFGAVDWSSETTIAKLKGILE